MRKFLYDLFVIGGGAGGLASSKAAASLGKKVGLADFAIPGPHQTVWGAGGTCVNVGCVPTKLMPYASRMGEIRKEQFNAGFNGIDLNGKHDWSQLIETVQHHIRELNQRQESSLKDNKVDFYNMLARFIDRNNIELTDKDGKKSFVSAENIIICVGSRPILYQDGSLVITSEDLFSHLRAPGKTMVVGASYVGLECAGFIHGFGYDTSVLARSSVLRSFDNEMAGRVEGYMAANGIKFHKHSLLQSIEAVGKDQRRVKWVKEGKEESDVFDTVLYAVGRRASTAKLNLTAVGVRQDPNSLKIYTDEWDRTSAENIYAIGDCAQGRLEYTPIAVMAGRKLAQRLYGEKKEIMNYADVATTIYTPIEYGCVGLSEERAVANFGKEQLKIYRSSFKPLRWNFNSRNDWRFCGAKLIVHKESDRVVGCHYVGPEAAEVIQGFAVAMKMKAKKSDFDETVAIHPSLAEELVLMR